MRDDGEVIRKESDDSEVIRDGEMIRDDGEVILR